MILYLILANPNGETIQDLATKTQRSQQYVKGELNKLKNDGFIYLIAGEQINPITQQVNQVIRYVHQSQRPALTNSNATT